MTGTTFQTHGVLSAATGILMGDIDALYEVGSFLLGRSIFTHELAFYGEAMQQALTSAIPDLPTNVTKENWQEARDSFIAKHGETLDLPGSLSGSLADKEDAVSTLSAML